jgi:lysosomal acid lipase/cholesteryl ester hydrolase
MNPSHYFRQYLPVYAAHTPSGTSMQNLIHYQQMIKHKQLQKYDHHAQNNNRYLSPKPPAYDLKNVKVPLLVYYG